MFMFIIFIRNKSKPLISHCFETTKCYGLSLNKNILRVVLLNALVSSKYSCGYVYYNKLQKTLIEMIVWSVAIY